MAAAAAASATTAFTLIMVVVVIMAVIVVMMMAICTVNVAMSQFFRRGFADSNHFNVEVQVLTRQHVVTINHDVIIFHFGDFYRYRP